MHACFLFCSPAPFDDGDMTSSKVVILRADYPGKNEDLYLYGRTADSPSMDSIITMETFVIIILHNMRLAKIGHGSCSLQFTEI